MLGLIADLAFPVLFNPVPLTLLRPTAMCAWLVWFSSPIVVALVAKLLLLFKPGCWPLILESALTPFWRSIPLKRRDTFLLKTSSWLLSWTFERLSSLSELPRPLLRLAALSRLLDLKGYDFFLSLIFCMALSSILKRLPSLGFKGSWYGSCCYSCDISSLLLITWMPWGRSLWNK